MSEQQVPSVGRVVHYVSHGTPVREDGTQAYSAQCRAAVITEVGEWPEGKTSEDARRNIAVPVGLAVLNPSGMFFHSLSDGGCVQSEVGREGGTWHWPERV
ncbi:hypothetical protein [Streptomyces sp. NPDC093591]|uniref:hypothetical protein n=1 Tax=Streptomyces sp. NPDC093591 TaxID=3366044 RepID=UPI0038079501